MSGFSVVYAESMEAVERGLLAKDEGLTSERIAEGDIESSIVDTDAGKDCLGNFGV